MTKVTILKGTIFNGLAALLLTSALPAFAQEKTKEVSESYGSRQEYVTALSGDRYVFRCWGSSKLGDDIGDNNMFALLRSLLTEEGREYLSYFQFKEGSSYCSMERSRKKGIGSGYNSKDITADELTADEVYHFDFAPPIRDTYVLICTASSDANELPVSVEGRKDFVFKDRAGKACVFMGIPGSEEGKFKEKPGKNELGNKK